MLGDKSSLQFCKNRWQLPSVSAPTKNHQRLLALDKQENPQGHYTLPLFTLPSGCKILLWPLKIRALACAVKDTANICLAKRKPEVWGKKPRTKMGITRPCSDGGVKAISSLALSTQVYEWVPAIQGKSLASIP